MTNVHDNSTKAFIDERPIMVTVQRRKRTATADGGWKWEVERILPPQRCRQVFKGNVSDQNLRTLSDGRIVNVQASLVFTSDGDVKDGDLAILPDDETWEVARVVDRYAVKAEVFQYAST